ncbi:MAG TPA: VOC family protein [Bacillales bacterium]|nr:VOC family protein [Bacillales bacterium]
MTELKGVGALKFIKRVDSIFIPVKDIKESEEWYKKVFDLTVVYRSEDNIGFRFNEPWPLKTGLSLYKSEEAGKPSPVHFNFYTEDVDGFYQYLSDEGVEPDEVQSEDGMRFFDFHDPSGNRFNVVTFKEIALEHID